MLHSSLFFSFLFAKRGQSVFLMDVMGAEITINLKNCTKTEREETRTHWKRGRNALSRVKTLELRQWCTTTCKCSVQLCLRLLCGVGGYPPHVLQPTEAYGTNPAFASPVITRGAPHQTMWEASISERRNYGREMAFNCDFHGSFTCRKAATWDRRLYFFSPEKSDSFGRVWTREHGYQRPAC
jgi:hypothetical protein